ncbi:MAG: hypothetical protein ACOH2J_03245 [Allorhizobium sp.]
MADTNMQTELRDLQDQVTKLTANLARQGEKTAGQFRERTAVALNGASRKAEDAADYARSEVATVAGVVREHPAATSTALLTVGLLGGLIGYFLASTTAADNSSRRWY